jgi:hypothetical protein
MKEFLQKIKDVPGVSGVFIINNRAELIASVGDDPLSKEDKENLGMQVLQLLSAFVIKSYPVIDSDFIFQNIRLLYFNYDKLNLFVYCHRNVKISMLRMTINVIMVEAMEDKKIKKIISQNMIDSELLLRDNRLDPAEKPYVDAIRAS